MVGLGILAPVRRLARMTLLGPIYAVSVVALLILLIGGVLAISHASTRFVGLVVVWLISGVSAGAFLGLLFGIPRRNRVESDAPGDGQTGPARNGLAHTPFGYGGNTNFEEISDWLTKIIVGATLVGLHDALGAIWSLAKGMDAFSDGNTSAGASLVVGAGGTGIVAGFLSMYLWTRSQLPKLFNDAENPEWPKEAVSEFRTDSDFEKLADGPTGGPSSPPGEGTSPSAATFRPTGVAPWSGGLAGLSRKEIWDKDFNKGRFGKEFQRSCRVLLATLGQSTSKSIEVTLTVRSTDPIRFPLVGQVTFYLHPTFTVPIIKVDAVESVAQTRIRTADAFTIGVECDEGRTSLELDLADLSGFPVHLGGKRPAQKSTSDVEEREVTEKITPASADERNAKFPPETGSAE